MKKLRKTRIPPSGFEKIYGHVDKFLLSEFELEDKSRYVKNEEDENTDRRSNFDDDEKEKTYQDILNYRSNRKKHD